MGLAQVINQNIKHPDVRCVAKQTIDLIDGEDRESVENAIVLLRTGEARFSNAWLAKQISGEGYKISLTTFGKHVRKECCCEIK